LYNTFIYTHLLRNFWNLLGDALDAFDKHSGWIIWNLFLAFIPWLLAFGYSGGKQTLIPVVDWFIAFCLTPLPVDRHHSPD